MKPIKLVTSDEWERRFYCYSGYDPGRSKRKKAWQLTFFNTNSHLAPVVQQMDSTIHCLNNWGQQYKITKGTGIAANYRVISLLSGVLGSNNIGNIAEGNIQPLLSAIKIKQL